MRSRALRLVALVGLVAAVALGPTADAAVQYYDGTYKYSTITNCVSIIQGDPYSEHGAGAYVGQAADTDTAEPKVGQVFYIHLVIYGLGNACSGQRFLPGIDLPDGVTPAISSTNKIICYAAGQADPGDCGQTLQSNTFGSGTYGYRSPDSQHGGLWPLPQGKSWEFQIPVVSTKQLSGTQWNGFFEMADGNDDPTLQPTQNMFVFAGAGGGSGNPAILYDGIGTVASPTLPGSGGAATAYGIASTGTVVLNGASGDGKFQLATTSDVSGAQILDAGHFNGTQVSTVSQAEDWYEPSTSWPTLQPGQTYYWRYGFQKDGSSSITWGATKSFQALTQPTCGGQKITVSLALGQQPTSGNDVILGTTGDDQIAGAASGDYVCAGSGDDVISATSNPSYVDGGAGTNTISFAAATGGQSINLNNYANVQDATGSPFADDITGTDAANALVGGAGNDVITGNGGKDLIAPGTGQDTVDGGQGNDTLTYANGNGKVKASLSKLNVFQAFDASNGVTLLDSIENLIGGKAADQLTGSSANNVLTGGAGNDKLVGGGGTDTCNGGSGTDTASGCEHKTGIP